jgi:bifunctional DNA-binding transcriptional regulator/antitoxin component of YhaV-PrlF toxin-antitoxin module
LVIKTRRDEMNKKMEKGPIMKLRRAVNSHGTLYVALPREFVERHGIKAGEKLPIIADHILKIIPMKEV